MILRFLMLSLASLGGLGTTSAQIAGDPEMAPFAGVHEWELDHDERMQWFREARFGMFIHLGLYSAAGGYWPPIPGEGKKYDQHYSEWIRTWASVPEPEYGRRLKPLFAPEPDCTEAWAALAKEAGMRYAVFTTKHHEGYTLFNSKAAYPVANEVTGGTNVSPVGRDLFAEYVTSFRKAGVVPGAYYSLIDWQFPDASRYPEYLHSHLSELAANYGPLGVLWVDYSSAGSEGSRWGARSILEDWRRRQPKAIINNRFWNGLENPNGDFFTPEKYVPPTGYPGRDFEVCHTLNESFGYSRHDEKWKTSEDVLLLLSDIASKGGNLLLNVGPDEKGRIPEPAAQALRGVGRWLASHGQAIYGTTAGPFRSMPFKGRCTFAVRGGEHLLFCHLHQWPDDGFLSLDGLTTSILSAHLMGNPEATLGLIPGPSPVIQLPSLPPDLANPMPVVILKLSGPPVVDPSPYAKQAIDRSVRVSAAQAVVAPSPDSPQPVRLEDDHIGWWAVKADTAWFPLMMTNPGTTRHSGGDVVQGSGKFDLQLDLSVATGSGGEVELQVLDQTLRCKIESTGGWEHYRKVSAGKLTISQAGLMTIHVKPVEIRGQGLMNLRGIHLIPVED